MSKITTDQGFESEVLKAKGLSVVDFWAEWCGPCKALSPTIEEIAREKEGVNVFKMDVDANPQTPTRFHIRGIPTILFFQDGQLVDQLVGAHSKDTILKTIAKHTAA